MLLFEVSLNKIQDCSKYLWTNFFEPHLNFIVIFCLSVSYAKNAIVLPLNKNDNVLKSLDLPLT